MFALSGLGAENDLSRVKRGRWNKKFEKHSSSVYGYQLHT